VCRSLGGGVRELQAYMHRLHFVCNILFHMSRSLKSQNPTKVSLWDSGVLHLAKRAQGDPQWEHVRVLFCFPLLMGGGLAHPSGKLRDARMRRALRLLQHEGEDICEKVRQEACLAMCMGTHPRLGARSSMRCLDRELLGLIESLIDLRMTEQGDENC